MFNFQILPESDERPAILFRYESMPILESMAPSLNTGEHHCIAVKKNNQVYAFFISLGNSIVKVFAIYDEERICFKVLESGKLDTIYESGIEYDKVSILDKNLSFAFKAEGWRYKSRLGRDTTEQLSESLVLLENHDAKIEEIRRQEEIRLRKEEEDRNAELQLTVWRKYVQKERELLENAGKPFALSAKPADIKKTFVDIETLSQISAIADEMMLADIVEVIGGSVIGNRIQMTFREFESWQNDENENSVLKELEASFFGTIELNTKVRCEGFWIAKNFKKENRYVGREEFRYGQYDRISESIDLEYESLYPHDIIRFFEKVYNYFDFRGVDKDATLVEFSLKVKTTETPEEREKRINILANRDLYSKPNMKGIYLGKLSKNGSDKKNVRIVFSGEKEEKKAAKEFFENIGAKSVLIYPGLQKDKVLLDRELDSLNKLSKPTELFNPKLNEYIFNSSRATATEAFTGLSKEMLTQTEEYKDCQATQLLHLNSSQQEAVVKGLYAKDLCLLQGPPGTGKTTVISELIWQHIRKNQRVRLMLTSQTNLAIDNALNRLFSNSALNSESGSWRNIMLIKPIRKADKDKVEEEGRPFTKERIQSWVNEEEEEISSNNIVSRWMAHIANRTMSSDQRYSDVLNEWKQSLLSPNHSLREIFATQYLRDSNVVCITCGKVNYKDPEINKGFDVVIVDEASKATPPELLLPLCYSKKSIIIGDYRQLPPVIFEEEFFKKIKEIDPDLEAELDMQFRHDLVEESLFKRLITHPYLSPSITASVNIQYRMHPDINNVISQFYPSGLECGLSLSNVDYPDFSNRDSRYHGLSLGNFIQPNVHTIWVDVPDGMEQGGEGSSTYNEKEVEAVNLVIEALSQANGFDKYMNFWKNSPNIETRITESRIGIISFYAAQVQRIRTKIQSYCDRNSIKVSTKSVDKFQGQESGIVIVSTVRTRRLGFTRTPERLNVALSRARRLLIIVGNSNFYSSEDAKTDDNRLIYRNVIEQIKDPNNNDVFIDYREIKALLGY